MQSRMNLALHRQCAGLFVVGFPGLTPDPDLLALLDDGVAGVIIFNEICFRLLKTDAMAVRLRKSGEIRASP